MQRTLCDYRLVGTLVFLSPPKSVEVVFSFAEQELAQLKRITWMIAMDGVKCDSVTGCVLLRNTASGYYKYGINKGNDKLRVSLVLKRNACPTADY